MCTADVLADSDPGPGACKICNSCNVNEEFPVLGEISEGEEMKSILMSCTLLFRAE